MAVYDRWYKDERKDDGTGKLVRTGKRVRSADYGCEHRWQVRYRDEQSKQKAQVFEKKSEAEQFDAKVRTQLKEGTYVDPSAGLVTFREYAEQWRQGRVHDVATAVRMESAFRNHVYAAEGTTHRTPTGAPALGDHAMSKLAKQSVTLVQPWIKGIPGSPNTARKIIADVSQVFTAAADEGIITRNPLTLKSVQKPKKVKTEAVPWTAAQVEAVAGELPGRVSALCYLGAACGMRQGELFGVAVSDIDFLRKTVCVEVQVKFVSGVMFFAPLKNDKKHTAPIADPVIPVLAEHVRQYPPVRVTLPWGKPDGKPVTRELLFTMNGRALNRHDFNRIWRQSWRTAGIPDRGRKNGCHALRHTAASEWLSKGLNIAKVAAALGDTVQVIASTYAHFMPDDDDRAREIMNAFFMSGSGDADTALCATDVQKGSR